MRNKKIHIFKGRVLQTKIESNRTIIYLTDPTEYLSSYIEDNYKDLEDFVNNYALLKKLSNFHKELLISSGLDIVAEYIADNPSKPNKNKALFPYLKEISQDVLYHYTTFELTRDWSFRGSKAANDIVPDIDFLERHTAGTTDDFSFSLPELFIGQYMNNRWGSITDLLGHFQWLEFVREDEKFDYRHRIKLLIKDKEDNLLIQAFTDIDYGA